MAGGNWLRGWFRTEASTDRPARVVLIWWGAFSGGGGATVGDYHAVANVAHWLIERGIDCEIVSGVEDDFPGVRMIDPDGGDERRYGALAFVCGPLVLTSKLKRTLRRFRRLPAIAVGVSDIGDRRVMRYFKEIVVRDSPRATTFDLALADADSSGRADSGRPGRPAVCLRGMQKTYGKENCLAGEADEAIANAMRARVGDFVQIDTRLTARNGRVEIEEQFATTSLLVTTRMHGALFALANRVPFIGVDQIRGGAKVSRILQELGWPHTYRVDQMRSGDLDRAIDLIMETGWSPEMETLRTRAIDLSRAALKEAGEGILRVMQHQSSDRHE